MHLDHAKHNYEVCLFLNEKTEYNDWIITTAYYSAIHFVYSKLFPNKYEDPLMVNIRHFNTFEKYCQRLPANCNKHKATEDLVMEHLPEIYSEYKVLKDNCWTARYDNYIVLDSIVNQCIEGLKLIAEFCEEIQN